MDAKDLAKRVIAVLDKQREYFKTRRTDVLRESKTAEADLRKLCNEIINNDTQQSLF